MTLREATKMEKTLNANHRPARADDCRYRDLPGNGPSWVISGFILVGMIVAGVAACMYLLDKFERMVLL